MVFCDLDRGGVEFCARAFSGEGIVSEAELTRVPLPTVDVIWVGSLFTHVDRIRATRWLTYLVEHLTPHGVLVATFHGRYTIEFQKRYPMIDPTSWASVLAQYERTGFGYAPYGSAEFGDYGVSLAKASAIVDIVSGIDGVRLIGYVERGWADNHDVVMVAKHDRLESWG